MQRRTIPKPNQLIRAQSALATDYDAGGLTDGTCGTGNAQCGANKPVCDGMTHACRACMGNNECPMATPYCAQGGACYGCLTDAHCGGLKPVCDAMLHACRACAAGAGGQRTNQAAFVPGARRRQRRGPAGALSHSAEPGRGCG